MSQETILEVVAETNIKLDDIAKSLGRIADALEAFNHAAIACKGDDAEYIHLFVGESRP